MSHSSSHDSICTLPDEETESYDSASPPSSAPMPSFVATRPAASFAPPPVQNLRRPRETLDLSSEFDRAPEHQVALFDLAYSGKWRFHFDNSGQELYWWTHQQGVTTNHLRDRRLISEADSAKLRTKVNRNKDFDPYSNRLSKGAEDRLFGECTSIFS